MKKILLTSLAFLGLCSNAVAQNILIEKTLFKSPKKIDVTSYNANEGLLYFNAENNDGILLYDLNTFMVALDTMNGLNQPLSYHKMGSIFSLVQVAQNELVLRNELFNDTTYLLAPTDSVNLPKLRYNTSTGYFYGVLDSNRILRIAISIEGIESIDTVDAAQTSLEILDLNFFNERTYFTATDGEATQLYLLDSNTFIKLRYPLNYGESTYGIQIINEDSLLVTRMLRQGEHELALLYATQIAIHPDTIKLRKQQELSKSTYDSVYRKDSVFVQESQTTSPRNTGKGRWALLVARTTDALKAMTTLNNILKIEPRAYSIKKDSVYFILGPRHEDELAVKTDSIYFAENGFSSVSYDLKADSAALPSDVVVRLECLDATSGIRPSFRADFYEYESNTLLKATDVQPGEVAYFSYYPKFTLGLTVTSEGYLPFSKRFEPSLELINDRRTEVLVVLEKIDSKESPEFALQNVYFAFNKHILTPAAKRELDLIIPSFKNAQGLIVEGHTDNIGSDAYNLTLSDKRAASVVAYLKSQGVEIQFKVVGKGESEPALNNATEKGRSKNRRVEITLL